MFIAVLWWDIFNSLYLKTWFGFYVGFFFWKKNQKFWKTKACFHRFPFTSNSKNHRFRNIVYPSPRLWRQGNNIFKIEIKQAKMNLFCRHFYPIFSTNSFTTLYYTWTAKVRLREIKHVHHIWVTSQFAYAELQITRSIFSILLDNGYWLPIKNNTRNFVLAIWLAFGSASHWNCLPLNENYSELLSSLKALQLHLIFYPWFRLDQCWEYLTKSSGQISHLFGRNMANNLF